MTIAVLCYSTCELDIIRDVPNFTTEEEVDNFLIETCGYNPAEISYMFPVKGEDIKINNLTPASFG